MTADAKLESLRSELKSRVGGMVSAASLLLAEMDRASTIEELRRSPQLLEFRGAERKLFQWLLNAQKEVG